MAATGSDDETLSAFVARNGGDDEQHRWRAIVDLLGARRVDAFTGGDGGAGADGFRAAAAAAGGAAVILAAGVGRRFHQVAAPPSSSPNAEAAPKVAQLCAGRPMAAFSLAAAAAAGLPAALVVGHRADAVLDALLADDANNSAASSAPPPARTLLLDEFRIGTGHALYTARSLFSSAPPPPISAPAAAADCPQVLLLYADNPGIDGELISRLLRSQRRFSSAAAEGDGAGGGCAATVLTGSRAAARTQSRGYGRIVRLSGAETDDFDGFCGGWMADIVERSDIEQLRRDGGVRRILGGGGAAERALDAARLDAIDEFNSGVLAARADVLFDVLRGVRRAAAAGEFYATDFVRMAVARGHRVRALRVPPALTWRLEGANTAEELAVLDRRLADSLRT